MKESRKININSKRFILSRVGNLFPIILLHLTLFLLPISDLKSHSPDSLRNLISLATEPERKVNLYLQLAKDYFYDQRTHNFELANKFADSALDLSKEIQFKKGEAEALLLIGKNKLVQSNHLDIATLYFLKSLNIFERLRDSSGIAGCNMQLGLVSLELVNYADAVSFFNKAFSKLPPKSPMRATAQYLMALSYSELDSINDAISNFEQALHEYKRQGNTKGAFECELFIGKMFTNCGNYELALEQLQETINTSHFRNDSTDLAPGFVFMSTAFYKAKDYKNAVRYGKLGYKLLLKANGGGMYLKEAESTLSKAYAELGNMKEAYLFLSKLGNLKDSLLNYTTMRRIANIKSQYLFEQITHTQRDEQQIKDTLTRKELEKQKLFSNALLLGLVVVFLFALVFFRQRNVIKKGNIALMTAKERAEQSELAEQQFLANMSHEIRTPMNAVVGMTSLLLETPLNKKQRSYLDGIKASSENLLHIINDILDLAKVESGKVELEKIDFSVRGIVKQVKQTIQHKAEEKGLEFQIDIDPAVPSVAMGDPIRLSQILLNLAGNAVKFTEAGSITIKVNMSEDKSRLQFSVIDTGIGIAKGKLDSVFLSFTQANASDTRKYGGTGLGLTISKQLVELMGGQISIISEVSQGTTFSFWIPFESGSNERLMERLTKEEEADGSLLNSLSILVVDDNEFNCVVAKDTLELKSEAKVVTVSSADEAIEILKEEHFDVILMDVQMPVMNGLEATRFIRTNFESPVKDIPIIALTASVVRSDIDKCRTAGMDGFIPKPFSAFQLITGLTSTLKLSAKVSQNESENRNDMWQDGEKFTNMNYLEKFCEGDKLRMKKYVDLFLSSAPLLVEKINSALSKSEFEEIANQVHGFKTRWIMMGMTRTADLAQKIEHQCRNGREEAILKADVEMLLGHIDGAMMELSNTSSIKI